MAADELRRIEDADVPGPAAVRERGLLEATLDLVPTPAILIDPATAAVTYANRAADTLAGGSFPRAGSAAEYAAAYVCTDAEGRRIPDEQMPGVRAARGERLQHFEMDWHLPDGRHALLISTDTVHDTAGRPVGLVVFEDITELKDAEREKDETLALLDTLFHSAPVGLAFFDRQLRYVRVNEALAEINGVPAADHAGRTVAEVLPDMGASVVQGFERALRSGDSVTGVEVTGRTPAEPDRDRHWHAGWYPVRHRSGDILGLGLVVVDVSERVRLLEAERRARDRAERAERRAAFLARVGEQLSRSLNYEETLTRVARVAVPDKADWCAIDMLGEGGRLRRPAVAHADPEKERLARELAERFPIEPDEPAGVAAVVRTGQPELYREIADTNLRALARSDEHLRILRELGLASLIIAPLRVRGRTVGAISFVLAESGGRFSDDDLELAMEVARRASGAIENAQLYRERSHIAQTLQRSLLPPRLPEVPGFDVAARYRAAGEGFDVGGDFYDLFETRDGRWSVVVGDVCGKGPEAAALTSLARYTMRAAALVRSDPASVLETTNAAILREPTEGRFMSAANACLDVEADPPRLVLANGGHPPALVLRADGRVEAIEVGGPLLGIVEDAAYASQAVEVGRGDALVLYTDGVLDAGAPSTMLAPECLEAVLAGAAGGTASELAGAVERAALDAADGPPRDDIAIIVLRRT